ncbi:MAG: ATP-binding cassette domain-containing protein [Desulfobacterales bacterium]|jgi:ABC-type multidrug transport system ATPase subunit
MSMRLECRNLHYRYPAAETPLFSNCGFSIEGPGFHALFGPSGVGKTTLARLLVSRPENCSGTVSMPGISQVLYAYNTERLPDWAGIGIHLKRVVPPEMADQREALVERFGMADLMESRFSQLSLGQKNRINLIRYLLQDFDLLIMDESLANVDEKTRERILMEIKERFPDKLFLYISHNIVEVARFCRKILVLRGSDKTPQAVVVDGLDLTKGAPVERRALDQTLLEIMNAA